MEMYDEAVIPTNTQQELLARLGRPETAEALNRLLDRLDLIAFAADAADGFLRRGDEVIESVADNVGELRHATAPPDLRRLGEKLPQLARTGVQMADLAANPAFERVLSSGLLERLGDPNTIESLHHLLDHLDLASFSLTAVDGFLRRGDVIADSVADSVSEATKMEPRIDLGRIKELAAALPALADIAVHVIRSGFLNHVNDLVDTVNELHASGVFSPEMLGVVQELGAAARTARQQKEYAAAAPKGVFGLLGALRDPDVQTTLGFAIAFSRSYGKTLKRGSHITANA